MSNTRRIPSLVSAGSLIFSFLLATSPSWARPRTVSLIERATVHAMKNGVEVQVQFSSLAGLKTDQLMERGFFQLSVSGATAKTAQVIPLSGEEGSGVERIFIYPFDPKTVRIRALLRDPTYWKPEDITWSMDSGKRLVLRFRNPESPVKGIENSSKSEENQSEMMSSHSLRREPEDSLAIQDQGQKLSEKEIINKENSISVVNVDKAAPSVTQAGSVPAETSIIEHPKGLRETQRQSDLGLKSDPSVSFGRMALALFSVLLVFTGGVALMKKYGDRLPLKKLGISPKEKLIQIIATHRLGKTQSISLVKVTGEYMVIGSTGDNLSLLTRLGPEAKVERYLEDRTWGMNFEKQLKDLSKSSDSIEPSLLSLGSASPEGIRENAVESGLTQAYETRKMDGRGYDGFRDVNERGSVPVASRGEKSSDILANIRTRTAGFKDLG